MTRTVLCYGDSNTHGTIPMATLADRGRHAPDIRWPGRLGAGWRVVEEGLPGRTMVHVDPVAGEHLNGLAVLPAALNSHRPLDAVVLMLGTNDCKARFGLSAGDIALSMDRLLACVATSATGPGGGAPTMLVVCPAPVLETGCLADQFTGGAARSGALAAPLARVAAARGAAFLDAGTVIAVDPLDGVHLSAAAHSLLGAAVAAALARL